MGPIEMYQVGGGWMWVISAISIITLGLVIWQIARIRSADLSRIVWVLLIVNPLVGILGTLVGLTQAGMHIALMSVEKMPEAVLKSLAIAFTTTEMALLHTIPLAIIFSIAHHKRHRLLRSQTAAS